MIRVAIVTSWGERCGIAEYAKNLIIHCKGIDFEIIPRNYPVNEAIGLIQQCSAFILNYEPGILGHWHKHVIQACGKPSILILHTSFEGDNRSEFTDVFTKVVTHEKTANTGTHNFAFIPMGVPVFNEDREKSPFKFDVGSVGFPFPWKGFTQIVEACKAINYSCLIVIPESRHADAQQMKQHLLSVHDKVTVVTDWLSQEETIRCLKQCSLTAFPYHGGNYGISAACRLGLATGNPIVLSRCRQFRDLFEYEDEIQFVGQPINVDDLARCFSYIKMTNTKPKKVLEDQNWNKIGELYKNLIMGII